MLCYNVANTIDSKDTTRVFRVSVDGNWQTLEEYHGHDLHDLEVRFNDLLRHSIRIMQQWSLDAE